MDSNNLATLFAPNILLPPKISNKDELSAECVEERSDAINVVRALIENFLELYQVKHYKHTYVLTRSLPTFVANGFCRPNYQFRPIPKWKAYPQTKYFICLNVYFTEIPIQKRLLHTFLWVFILRYTYVMSRHSFFQTMKMCWRPIVTGMWLKKNISFLNKNFFVGK